MVVPFNEPGAVQSNPACSGCHPLGAVRWWHARDQDLQEVQQGTPDGTGVASEVFLPQAYRPQQALFKPLDDRLCLTFTASATLVQYRLLDSRSTHRFSAWSV